ncbi:MAG: aminotransferase class V-fold PLP-dependent enzyme [Acetobacteraceae bacterium]|nr:aminotransferase class V-fold PLP-dependent enzyme [Acetobacteraceae bacterium]
MSVFERFGVTPVINACGPVTRLGGGVMHPEVAAAMVEASRLCCDMLDLQAAACRVIARVTGAEAGIVTSGASAAVLLGAASCLAGLDPGRMNRLPQVQGRREIVVVRSQRNMYDRALVVAGAQLIEVGIPDRYSGPGVRDADAWEIEDAIGSETAGVYYLAQKQSVPSLASVAEIAHRRGVPVLVDAAAQLPPSANLRAILAEGADLVAFSGGKAIGGPQASGILCGRADLVSSALVQMLDLDVRPGEWRAPQEFAPLAQLRGLPHHGIGRSCKAGKEEIIGLLTALERFATEGDSERRARWTLLLKEIADAGSPLSGAEISVTGPVPLLRWPTLRAEQIAAALRSGSPSIACSVVDRALQISPVSLDPEHAAIIARRLRELSVAS